MTMLDITPVKYQKDGLYLLDQTRLPNVERYLKISAKEDIWEAIYHLRVRGAPAIGIAAAYGIFISVRDFHGEDFDAFRKEFSAVRKYLESARPTAVNLTWALGRMEKKLLESRDLPLDEIKRRLLMEAEAIQREDEAACYAMGEYGLSLLSPGAGILTHCNAGTVATAKYGTCLAPIYLGHAKGYDFKVFAGETRPLLQGARVTAWELSKAGIDVTLICDNMAGVVMKNGWVNAVMVGCDRMAANGDGANKIGTLSIAVLAKEYGIPFYMFVPTSTLDFSTPTGKDINVEQRDGEEIYKMWYKKDMAPAGVKTYNPAFDVTDAKYISAVITEKGIVYPPFGENLKKVAVNK